MPDGVTPSLGPDATALGQIYWYTLEGRDESGNPNGGWDPQKLRSIQDFYVKYALTSTKGVAEVASIGGYVKEYQIDIMPNAMKGNGVSIAQIIQAVKKSNLDIGARTIEFNRTEYLIRALGYIKNLEDLEKSVVAIKNNVPIRLKDVAKINFGPSTRRGGRVEMQLAELENNLALLKDKWFVNIVKFNNLLNINDDSQVEIPNTLWTYDLAYSRKAILDSLRLNNHQVLNLDYMLESFYSKEKLAKKNGKPNIILGLDYISIGDSNTSNKNRKDAFLVKVGVTIPLYRKKYTAMVKEAVLLQKSTENKKTNKINTLETIFEKVFKEYNDANRRIELYQKQSQLAGQAIKILESEYAYNDKKFEEILRMNKNLLKYSLELERARADKLASIAFINYLMGN